MNDTLGIRFIRSRMEKKPFRLNGIATSVN